MKAMGIRNRIFKHISPAEKKRLNLELLPELGNVQVYKDTFDLLLFVYTTLHDMRREYRYTLGEEMKRTLQNLLTAIYEARKTTPRSVMLIEALHWAYHAKVLYRTMDELGLLKDWQCAGYITQLSSISKQLTNWQKFEKKKETDLEKKHGDAPNDGT